MSHFRGQFEAILSSFCFGIAPIFAKKGLLSGLNPLYGVAIAIGTGLLVNILFVFLSGQWRGLVSIKRHSLLFAILAGVCNTIAILSFYWAMSIGKVALVVPITCIYPLFTMSAAYLFMRKSEVIDIWTALGTVLIIIGVILTI
jgi:transporter family protein